MVERVEHTIGNRRQPLIGNTGSVCLVLLLALLFPACSHALDSPPETAFYEQPTIAQVLALAATTTKEKYPDADAVVVDYEDYAGYKADDTAFVVHREFIKVLTEKGRARNAVMSFPFMDGFGTVSISRAEIFKPDGRKVVIDPVRNSNVMTDNSQMGMNIYNTFTKHLQLFIPGLEVGDLIHVNLMRTGSVNGNDSVWNDQTLLERVNPIRHLIHNVVDSSTKKYRFTLLNSSASNTVAYRSESLPGGGKHHRWVARDVPQIDPEPRMPDVGAVAQQVLVGGVPDWQTISRKYWGISKPLLETSTPEMERTVSNLVNGITDRDARIRRIFTYVSQRVRYLGVPNDDAWDFGPRDVGSTFERRYGVCSGKALLLVSMLRLAGIEVYPALIQTGPKINPIAPGPNFDHEIAAVKRPEGGYDLIDPTPESTRDLFPAHLGNRSYLVLHPAGESLRVSEVTPADRNMMRITSRGILDEDGTLALDIRLAFDGINDVECRSALIALSPDLRRRYFEEILQGKLAGVEVTALRIDPADLADTAVPLVVTLSCRARNYPVTDGSLTVLDVPWLSEAFGSVNSLVGDATLQQRKYPYVTGYGCGVEETVSIAIKHRVSRLLQCPDPVRFQRSGVDFGMTLSVTNNVLDGHSRYVLNKAEYSPAEYADLRQSLREREHATRQRPIFSSVFLRRHDSRILSCDTRIEVIDAHTWTRTRTRVCEVLTPAGIKRYGELIIPFKPAWQTVEMVSATVSNRNGTVHVVQPGEVNVMDEEWVGSAPRYPAGKLLVISFLGLEAGSVIRTTIRTTWRDAPFYWSKDDFVDFYPLQRLSLEIDAPLSLNLRVENRMADDLRCSSTTNDGRVVRRWEVDPLPTTKYEAHLPPFYMFRPGVLASTGDWSVYVSGLKRAFEAAVQGQTGACERARQLVKGLRNDRERVVAIRDYVARAVRVAGPSFTDLPSTCFTPADRTLADGYGNMADRAILLAAMLRAVGLNAEIVLASSSPLQAKGMLEPLLATPQIPLYDDVLVSVTLGGQTIYLNDSDQYGVLGATVYDRYPLLSLNGETGRVAVAETYRDRSREDWTVTLETNGNATVSVTNWFSGASCGAFRKRYGEMLPGERNRAFQQLVGDISRSATPIGGLTTDTNSYPGFSAFTVRADGYAVRKGWLLTLMLPNACRPILDLSASGRLNPIYIQNPSESEWTCRVILPHGVRNIPVLPKALAWPLPDGMGHVSFDVKRSRLPDGRHCLDLRRVVRIESVILPPTLNPALLEINRLLTHSAMGTVVAELE